MIMNKQEFLSNAGLQVRTLDLWLEQRWLIPEQTSAGANYNAENTCSAAARRSHRDAVNGQGTQAPTPPGR